MAKIALFVLFRQSRNVYGIVKPIAKVVISSIKIERSRGVLTRLSKSAQGLLLKPEIASFLVKISSPSKVGDMSD